MTAGHLTVIIMSCLLHHVHEHSLVVRLIENCLFREFWIEFRRPLPLEVRGVGQHQFGALTQRSGHQKILDIALGHVLNKTVDVLAATFSIFGEIEFFQIVGECFQHAISVENDTHNKKIINTYITTPSLLSTHLTLCCSATKILSTELKSTDRLTALVKRR